MRTYVFYLNFDSLDFGKSKFWLTIILVGQKLVANQDVNVKLNIFINKTIYNFLARQYMYSSFFPLFMKNSNMRN